MKKFGRIGGRRTKRDDKNQSFLEGKTKILASNHDLDLERTNFKEDRRDFIEYLN